MSDDVLSELKKATRSLRRAAAKGRWSVATGSLSGPSAEALAAKWEQRSKELIARAEKWEAEHPLHGDEGTRGEADGYFLCAQELRREMGLPIKRQPTENAADEGRRKAFPRAAC